MGLTCIAADYLCCGDNQYQGNIIFKELETKLIVEGVNFSDDDKQILGKCENLLKQSEEERKKIADKFQDLLDHTGAGVLFQPTLERAIISYIIYLVEQIILCAKQKKVEFDKKDFSFSNFLTISKDPPFLKFNQEALDNLKKKYGFDINMIETLSKATKSIINFLSTVKNAKSVIQKQIEILGGLLVEFRKNLYLVTKLSSSMEGMKFILNYSSEFASSLILAQSELVKPRKIELFFKIANNAAEKGIQNPKELVLLYSLGENCGSIDKWKENMCYKKVEILKY